MYLLERGTATYSQGVWYRAEEIVRVHMTPGLMVSLTVHPEAWHTSLYFCLLSVLGVNSDGDMYLTPSNY